MIPVFDHTGPFIWTAYAFSAFVLAGLVLATLKRARDAKRRLEAIEQEAEQQA